MNDIPESIYRSMMSSLNTALTAYSIYFDGMLPNAEQPQSGLEIRFNGPRAWQESKGYWRYWVEINVLIYHNISTNILEKHRIAGDVVAALKGPFLITDGATTVGCMRINMDSRSGIRVNHFGGPIRPDVNLEQSTVVANYTMYYEET